MTDAPTTSAPTERSFRHTIRRDAGSKVSLEVEVDAERLTRQADRVFERHNQKAKIPGFRPGKAPRAMYERSYGAEHLWAEAAEDLVDQTYREIVELEDLSPLDDPKVDLAVGHAPAAWKPGGRVNAPRAKRQQGPKAGARSVLARKAFTA